MNISQYKRILILGNNGSGKSYLAKQIAKITNLPLIHLDSQFWRPNWKMPSQEEWFQKMTEFVSDDKWIIEGICTHGDTMDIRFQRADLIIFLDINRFVCLAGVVKRQGKQRSDTAIDHHLDEMFDKKFIKFCKGIWEFPKSKRRQEIMNLHKKYIEKPFVIISTRKEMSNFTC